MTFVSRDLSYQSQRLYDTGAISIMDRDVRKIVVLLACLLLPTSGRIQDDVAKDPRARHLFVQRDKPLPGSPKKLFKIEREEPSRSSGGQNVHELFRRVRRSLNPDMKPEAHKV